MFSVTNAANGYNKRNVGVTGDIDKFRMMFTPSLTVVTSYNSKIIYSPIFHHNKQDILQVCFKDDNDLAAGKAALSGYNTDNFVVDASLFINSRI